MTKTIRRVTPPHCPRSAMNFNTWKWVGCTIVDSEDLSHLSTVAPGHLLHWFVCRFGDMLPRSLMKSLSKMCTLQKMHKTSSLLLSFKGIFFITTFRVSKLPSTQNCSVWRNFSIVWFTQHFLQKKMLLNFAELQIFSRKLRYFYVFVWMQEITKEKPFEGSKHLNMPLVMQLVIPSLWPYDFKETV